MIRTAILFLVLCATATPAAAHWERTRWGMTRQEARALYPAATENAPSNSPWARPPTINIEGPYVFEGQSFNSVRLFFGRERLNQVELMVSGGGAAARVPGLVAWLERRYGRPVAVDGTPDAAVRGIGSYRADYRSADGDKVVFVVFRDGENALVALSFAPP